MKILDMQIDDPRMRGVYRDPFVEFRVDEEVNEIGDRIYSQTEGEIEYGVIPCGPFWAVEACANTPSGSWTDLDLVQGADYGELNKLNLLKNQLFPVQVYEPDGEPLELAMEVPRLRRLIRKFDFGFQYHLIVDEEAALNSLLKWRLESLNPVCYGGAVPQSAHCFAEPIHTIVYKGTHLPLCRRHRQEHEIRMHQARLSLVENN